MGRRVVRVLSYEGNPEWVERLMARALKVKYASQGTVLELQRLELDGGEELAGPLTVRVLREDK